MFWERFISECERAGKSPSAVGKDIQVSSATVSGWKGGSTPSADFVGLLADYFGTTADYLLGRTDDRRSIEEQLKDVQVGFWGGEGEITDAMKADIAEYLRFKKFQAAIKHENKE